MKAEAIQREGPRYVAAGSFDGAVSIFSRQQSAVYLCNTPTSEPPTLNARHSVRLHGEDHDGCCPMPTSRGAIRIRWIGVALVGRVFLARRESAATVGHAAEVRSSQGEPLAR